MSPVYTQSSSPPLSKKKRIWKNTILRILPAQRRGGGLRNITRPRNSPELHTGALMFWSYCVEHERQKVNSTA